MSTNLMLQDLIKCSRCKSQMLEGYGDTVLCTEALEEELAKEKLYSSHLLMKFDGIAAEYCNHIQQLEEDKGRLIARNKTLRHHIKSNLFSLLLPEY